MTATLHLWQIGDHYAAIMDEIADAGGELSPELEAQLTAIEDQFERKLEAVALYIRNLEATAMAAQQEADRLRALAVARENAARSLKRYVLEQMQRLGRDRCETDRITLRVQRNSRPSISWTGADTWPPETYVRVRREIDLQHAYEVWKAGEVLPPGFVVTQGVHLRIS